MQYSPKLWETLRAQSLLVFIELFNIESCYAGNVDIFPKICVCVCVCVCVRARTHTHIYTYA